MYCNKIATGVHHVIKNGEKVSTFFVAEGDYWEALQSVGELYLNQHDMHYFVSWATGVDRNEEDRPFLLISVDGKYGVIRSFSEIRGWNTDALIHQFLPEDQAVYGGYKEFKQSLDREVARDPFLAEKFQLPKPRNASIPERLKQSEARWVRLESFDSPIREAYQKPQWAKTDALIFAYLARENWQLHPDDRQVTAVEEFLRERLEDLVDAGNAGLFEIKGLTMKELEKRRSRAIRNRNAYWRKFPNPFEIELVGGMDAITRHTSKLSPDELVEMAVVAWYSSPELGAREKAAVIAADQRFADFKSEID